MLHLLDKLLARLARPFTKARRLEDYASSGYWVFGLLLVMLITLSLIATGYIASIFSRVPTNLAEYIRLALDKVGLGGLPATLPLVIILLAVYLGLGAKGSVRNALGETFANAFFRGMESAITGGEWCIRNRGWSTVIIISLGMILSVGLYREFGHARRLSLLQRDFNHWMQEAERFVTEDPFSQIDVQRMEELRSDWRSNFDEILGLPGGYLHPATQLNEMLALLSSVKAEETLITFLRGKADELEKIAEKCRQLCRPVEQMEPTERRLWDLINIQMGKNFNRMAENCEACDQFVAKAHGYFSAVDLLRYKPSNESDRPYLSAVNNGRGTIYASTLIKLVSGSHPDLAAKVCPDAAQCAVNAYKSYEDAGKNFEPCSLQDKRKLNNFADLLSRIAITYGSVANQHFSLQSYPWMESKGELAKKLESLVSEMMSCNKTGPFVSNGFITAAQAYGASVLLLEQERADASRQHRAAGTYLRIANSFEPTNLSDWELYYFCPMVRDGKLNANFEAAVRESLDGLPEVNLGLLKNKVLDQCNKAKFIKL